MLIVFNMDIFIPRTSQKNYTYAVSTHTYIHTYITHVNINIKQKILNKD